MKRFLDKNIKDFNVSTEKGNISCRLYKPETINSSTAFFIFCNGLGGTNEASVFMNYDAFQNNYMITYEKSGYGKNTCRPSKNYHYYTMELKKVIDWVMSNHPNKKIYLLGESWGSAIATLAYEKFPSLISGLVMWNMPYKIIDVESKSIKEKAITGFKILWTILTNKDTYDTVSSGSLKVMSSNPFLIRLISLNHNSIRNNKTSLAAWQGLMAGWRSLYKIINDDKFNIIYIQSGEDAMQDKKKVAKLLKLKTKDNVLCWEKGYHVLSFEEQCLVEFNNQIQRILK